MDKPVGYASPPSHTKWQKGQSGNPSGRKKGQRNLKTDLLAEVNEVIQVTEGGRARKLTKQQLVMKTLVTHAIKGNMTATSLLLSHLARSYGVEEEQVQEPPLDADEQDILDAFLARNPNQGTQS